MATNQLLPFATSAGANIPTFDEWKEMQTLLANGFQSGIASSKDVNRIVAQGGVAGYVIGQMVASLAGQDATIDAETLYTNFLTALKAYVGSFEFDDLPESWLDALMPAGEFVICAGTTLPPRTLLCNGAAVSRTTYSRLFTAIGTKYGAGDGSTTFNLPNLDGRVLQGTSDTSNVGKYLEASLPNITGHIPFLSCTSSTNTNAGSGSLLWTISPTGDVNYISSTGSGGHAYDPYIDASRSSQVFSGSGVQPAACLCLVAIRY